ncbi:hypothetical protein ASG12_10400 [Williamsia sp. Leaf354]|nr:hypothetical protein ASG12_10400 [Williamsia sp. Leaf354]
MGRARAPGCGAASTSVCGVLTAVALVPGAPLIVPEVSGPGAVADVDPIRDAVLEVGRRLAARASTWIAIGVAPHDGSPTPRTGTFAGFGVDLTVSLDPGTVAPPDGDTMPTPMLIAAWLRGRVADGVEIDPVLVDPSTTGTECTAIGQRLARRCATSDATIGILVVGDGSTGLTDRAPAGLLDGAAALQDRIDDALAAADLEALARLEEQTCAQMRIAGRAAWQVAAAAWTASGDASTTSVSLYRGAPFGVGYQVAWWER